jgi:hypothetical protein
MNIAHPRSKVKKKKKKRQRGKKPQSSKKRVSKRSRKKKRRSKQVSSRGRPSVNTRNEVSASRSEAAKKGWATRRLKAAQAAQAQSTERVNAATQFLQQKHVSRQLTDRLIDKGLLHLLRGDEVDSIETLILSGLAIAEQLGNFDQRAYELAEEYDWDPREVYTLWAYGAGEV